MKREQKLEQMLISIVDDVNKMRRKNHPGEFGWFTGEQPSGDYLVAIEWPNLDILVKEAEKLLKAK